MSVVAAQRASDGGLAAGSVRLPSTWLASLRAVYVIWYRDMLRFVRDRLRFVTSLSMAAL
jgi:hypothetical protein